MAKWLLLFLFDRKTFRRKSDGIALLDGVSAENFQKSIEAGVRNINYFTYMDKAGGSAAESYLKGLEEGEPVFFSAIFMAAREAMKEDVKNAMKVFAGR